MTFVAPPQADRDAMSARVTPEFILTSILTSMAIGMLCARSLHYQFFSWLAWSAPWLLYKSGLPPLVTAAVWFGQEMAWNVYPSNELSSKIVVGVLAAMVVRVWSNTDEEGDGDAKVEDAARRLREESAKGLRRVREPAKGRTE